MSFSCGDQMTNSELLCMMNAHQNYSDLHTVDHYVVWAIFKSVWKLFFHTVQNEMEENGLYIEISSNTSGYASCITKHEIEGQSRWLVINRSSVRHCLFMQVIRLRRWFSPSHLLSPSHLFHACHFGISFGFVPQFQHLPPLPPLSLFSKRSTVIYDVI